MFAALLSGDDDDSSSFKYYLLKEEGGSGGGSPLWPCLALPRGAVYKRQRATDQYLIALPSYRKRKLDCQLWESESALLCVLYQKVVCPALSESLRRAAAAAELPIRNVSGLVDSLFSPLICSSSSWCKEKRKEMKDLFLSLSGTLN